MPIKMLLLLLFFIGAFCVFAGALACADWLESRPKKQAKGNSAAGPFDAV